MNRIKPDGIIMSDALNHIPLSDRTEFFKGLKKRMNNSKTTLLIKEVEPAGFISGIDYISDCYMSGDKKISLICKAEIISTCENIFEKIKITKQLCFFKIVRSIYKHTLENRQTYYGPVRFRFKY